MKRMNGFLTYIKSGFQSLALNSAQGFIAVLLFLIGFRAIFSPHRIHDEALENLLPLWMYYPWGGLLFLGGVLILWGLFARFPQIEMAGLFASAGAAGIYLLGLILYSSIAPFVTVAWTAVLIAIVARYLALRALSEKVRRRS